MLKFRKIGVLKMSVFSGLFSFCIGLISTLLMLVTVKITSSLMITGMAGEIISNSFSLANLLILPFAYGFFGLIAGLIFTPIMNLIFKIINGLDIDIEEPSQ